MVPVFVFSVCFKSPLDEIRADRVADTVGLIHSAARIGHCCLGPVPWITGLDCPFGQVSEIGLIVSQPPSLGQKATKPIEIMLFREVDLDVD